MNGSLRPRSTYRSIGAVAAGFLAVVILSVGADAIMHGTGLFPPLGDPMSDFQFCVAAAYRLVFAIAGSYIAARLAPDRPMEHALTLGGLGMLLSTIGAVATWNAGPAFGPHWYPLTLVATALPCGWVGGKLYTK